MNNINLEKTILWGAMRRAVSILILVIIVAAAALLITQPMVKEAAYPQLVKASNPNYQYFPTLEIYPKKDVSGVSSLKDWIIKENLGQWVRIKVYDYVSSLDEVRIGRECSLKLSGDALKIFGEVKEVLKGDKSLEGKKILLIDPYFTFNGSVIRYDKSLYSVLPGRVYIMPIEVVPASTMANIVVKCRNKSYIYAEAPQEITEKAPIYKIKDYVARYLYGLDGHVYNLAGGRNLDKVDSEYIRIMHVPYMTEVVANMTFMNGASYSELREAVKNS